MTENRTKFKNALLICERSFYEELPYEEIPYSKKTYRRTLKMIRTEQYGRPLPVGKRLAVILAAALCSAMMLSAVKKPLKDFIVRTYEKYIAFIIRGENDQAPASLTTVYNQIGYLPAGYYREDIFKNGFSVQSIWRNRKNEKLILYQTLYSSTETMIGKKSDYVILYLSDIRIMITEKYGRKFFFWSFDGYTFELSGSAEITQEEYLKMIENLTGGH